MGMRRTMRQPGWSASNRNAERPLRASSEVRAIRMKCCAAPAPVMNHLRPWISHLSPWRVAVVRIIDGSEPLPGLGSVITKDERTLPSMMGCSQRSCWSGRATCASTRMLPSSGAAALKAAGPKMERFISS